MAGNTAADGRFRRVACWVAMARLLLGELVAPEQMTATECIRTLKRLRLRAGTPAARWLGGFAQAPQGEPE